MVRVGGVVSNLVEFTVLPTPAISSVAPTTGDIGSTIQISGANFGNTQGTSTVTSNGTMINIVTWSANRIAGTVPVGATTGNIIVTVGGVPSNPVSYTVVNVPGIFGLSPTLGPPGTLLPPQNQHYGCSNHS